MSSRSCAAGSHGSNSGRGGCERSMVRLSQSWKAGLEQEKPMTPSLDADGPCLHLMSCHRLIGSTDNSSPPDLELEKLSKFADVVSPNPYRSASTRQGSGRQSWPCSQNPTSTATPPDLVSLGKHGKHRTSYASQSTCFRRLLVATKA